jgi:hypothetical protein
MPPPVTISPRRALSWWRLSTISRPPVKVTCATFGVVTTASRLSNVRGCQQPADMPQGEIGERDRDLAVVDLRHRDPLLAVLRAQPDPG